MSSIFDRRQFFKQSLAIAGATSGILANAATSCILTREQEPGPYYPKADLNRDADLTRLDPLGKDAEGTVIELSGVIQDIACNPLKGALIEIWQANKHGKYDHPDDLNPLPVDANFQHWGRMTTGSDGKYLFRTIIPGYYPLRADLVGKKPSKKREFRPPHIHATIHARGFSPLTTQLYFHPDTYEDTTTKDIVTQLNGWEKVPTDLIILYAENKKDKTKPRTGDFTFTLTKR